MSWDFSLVADLGGPEPIVVIDGLNYTYNISPMFYEAFGPNGIGGLHGKLASDCADEIRLALEKMERDPPKYKAMNPSNGWGSYDGALCLLRDLLEQCERAPLARMRIS